VAGEQGRDVALDRLEGVAGVGAREHEEHIRDMIKRAAAPLQRLDGVGEARLGRARGDGVDLGAVAAQRLVEGGAEMPGPIAPNGGRPKAPRQSASSGLTFSEIDRRGCSCALSSAETASNASISRPSSARLRALRT